MNRTVTIDGHLYTFIESLAVLGTDGGVVICQDESGARFACPRDIWDIYSGNVIPSFEETKVTNKSTSDEKIVLFRSLFCGRSDVYAKRWYNIKTGQSGYSPACKNEWVQGICNKKAVSCGSCPNRDLLPLTDEVIYRHLEGRDEHGRDVVGLYPMLQDETTHFLALDFDDVGWREDVAAFRMACSKFSLLPAVERSRSGNGGHIWFFFREPVSAAKARALGSGLISRTMEHHATLKMKTYDRMFPNQDTLPKGGFGNLIALPLQGRARRLGNSVFINDQFEPWPDQWAFLSSVEKLGAEQLDELVHIVCREGELGELADSGEDHMPWEHPKPAKLIRADFPDTVQLTFADGIYIKKDGISEAARNRIKRLAAFRNPEFFKAQAMRLPTYNKPRVIDTSLDLPGYLKIPRGCEDPLKETLPQYTVLDKRNSGRSIDAVFNGELRHEQKPAAEAMLQYDTGVLSATTAFGKTIVGAYLIGARKVNTLILVHSSALLVQWKKALTQFLIINESLSELPVKRGRRRNSQVIGQLGSGKDSLHGIVDIATMQSLTNGDEIKELVRDYGMVICDECHHVPAVSFERILSAVTAKYVYGLTATPIRADGHQPIIFMQCGPIRYRVDAKEQADKRDFEHFIIQRFTRTRIPDVTELIIQEIYSKLIIDDTRNRFIVKDVLSTLNEGRTPLVLTERREHAVVLAKLLKDACPNVLLLTGSDGQKIKREKLQALKATPPDEPLIVIATGKYIGEGFDEPRLDTLFLTMPIAWKGTLAQYAGRLHRDFSGKYEVRIYDYVDIHVKVLERMYQKRLRGYTELGYQAKAGEDGGQTSVIFDNHSFYKPFAADITEMGHEALIISPFMSKARVPSIIHLLAVPIQQGAKITVITRPPEDYKPEQQAAIALLIDTLQSAGITVAMHSGIHQKYAVFDKKIVWYGSINFLSFGKSQESIMRFESADLAGELLDAAMME
jgi:superfamily II DNA or RNA helicase